jgi:hypothetical protein
MKSQNTHQTVKHSETVNARSTSSGSTPLDGISLIQRGNEYFFSDCYLEATGYYYQAAMVLKNFKDHRVERSKAWSNVAECHLRLQNWQAAEDASTNALVADPSNSKARYRRAKARFELRDYAGASMDADNVGTGDAKDVAALCRELAFAHFSQTLTVKSAATKDTRSDGTFERGGVERREPPPSPGRPTNSAEHERELWFRRIIDSYRLRIDDEYTQTGATDAGCLYGIRAKGLSLCPIDHFQAYVHRAVKKRAVPPWFAFGEMDELCRMATTDRFSNIKVAVGPSDIVNFYANSSHGEIQELRNLAVFIEGPIGMPWKAPPETRKVNLLKVNVPSSALAENRHNLGGPLLPSSARAPAAGMYSAEGVIVYPFTTHGSDGTHHHHPYQADLRHHRQRSTPAQIIGNNTGLHPFTDRYYQPFHHPSVQQAQQRGPLRTLKRDKGQPGKAGQTRGWEQQSLMKQSLHCDHRAFSSPRPGERRSPSPVPVSDESLSAFSECEQPSFIPSQRVVMNRPVGSGLCQQQLNGALYSQEQESSTSQHAHCGSRELREEFSELTELST